MHDQTYKRGLLVALLAFAIWGLFPIYWRLLATVGYFELLYMRLILTALACVLLLPMRGSLAGYTRAWRDLSLLKPTLLAAVLLSLNWFSFIWAVNSGNILQSSLGYFLCPIVTVLLGRFILKESMGRAQWLAVALAATGVVVLVQLAGQVPAAALVIAATWSSYGLLKKRTPLGPVVSLGLETSLLTPVAIVALLWMARTAPLSLGSLPTGTWVILLLSGFVTATPLLLFAYAAPRIRLSTIGMGQYIVPSCHFLLAYFYGEQVGAGVLGGFILIWIGLALYALSGVSSNAIDANGK